MANKPTYRVKYQQSSIRGHHFRYVTLGVGFDNESRLTGDPFVTIKLNAMPIGNDWDGTLFLFPIDQPEESDG